MQIKIVRNTGYYGSAGRLHVLIDEEKVGSIRQSERLYFPISKETAKVQVRSMGSKSNVLEVTAGDVLVLTITPVVWRAWFVSFLFMLAGLAVTYLPLKLIFFSIGFGIELSKFFWNEFHIEKRKNRD